MVRILFWWTVLAAFSVAWFHHHFSGGLVSCIVALLLCFVIVPFVVAGIIFNGLNMVLVAVCFCPAVDTLFAMLDKAAFVACQVAIEASSVISSLSLFFSHCCGSYLCWHLLGWG